MSGFDQPPSRPDEQPADAVEGGGAPPPSTEPAPDPAASPAKKAGGGRMALIVGGLAVGAGALFVKFGLPLLIGAVASQALGGLFGGPFNRLPSDVRSGFEDRFERAAGDRYDELNSESGSEQVIQLVAQGLPRLDDFTLVEHFRITSRAVQALDATTCASLSRAIFAGTTPADSDNEKMLSSLTDADLQRFFDIRILAFEAEMRGSPPAATVDDAMIDPMVDGLFAAMPQSELDALVAITSGQTVDDAQACAVLRGYYTVILAQPAPDLALWARYDVSP